MQRSMQAAIIFALLAAAAHASSEGLADTSATQVTPVEKVLELLNGMVAKGKKEKHDEQVQFAAYKQWCDDTMRQKQAAIVEANEMIEVLKADIQKYAADAEALAKEIG